MFSSLFTQKKKVKLPSKPSQLIRLAVRDLEKVERSRKFKVDMGTYFTRFRKSQPCLVCFAGAVMAQTMGVRPLKGRCSVTPLDFSPEDNDKLGALDLFRQGSIYSGCFEMHRSSSLPPYREVADYHSNPTQFKKDMRKLASDLRKEGN